jgi:asparagine synthase (glutamine-hydrolysing)
MCGIAGIVAPNGEVVGRPTLEAMTASLRHRGPDDDGYYVSGRVGLGMRRLSIIDVKGGRQPIHNEDKTLWAVFNGEIYNYRELRGTLEAAGHRFYTDSDTETIVHLHEEYGDGAVARLRGMFVYAVWDERRQRLILARDRIGIKPLYFSAREGRLLFASELKAFLQVPGASTELDPEAVARFLTYLYVPGPHTIYREIRELPPAHYLVHEAGRTEVCRYWTVRYHAREDVSEPEWHERVLVQFRESVKSHLVSEVPLGAFLSGGIDSSAIVAVMAQESGKPVETFSIGYEGNGAFQDERRFARLVAERFATRHHEFVVKPDIRSVLPRLVACFDQPFADSSAIPNHYISEMTRRHVTVALSGLGGDEIGGGYERYQGVLLGEQYRRVPGLVRRLAIDSWAPRLRESASGRPWADRLKRFVASGGEEPARRYAGMVAAFTRDGLGRLLAPDFVPDGAEAGDRGLVGDVFRSGDADDLAHSVMLTDLRLYLPGDLLALTDRVSMSHSLEVRVPFLDHPLVELMASVPSRYKVTALGKKILFRRAFAGLLPAEICRRRKVGFSVPLALWLRTDLRETMLEILSESEVKRLGYLDHREVDRIVREHLMRWANHENRLWALINLVAWHRWRRDS